MKIKLFNIRVFRSMSKNGKPYWSVTETAYKNESDKLTYFVSFSNKTPEPMPNKAQSKAGNPYEYIDLEEADCSLGCYNKTPQITIFSYKAKQTNVYWNSKMGGEKSQLGGYVDVKSDDLPFY